MTAITNIDLTDQTVGGSGVFDVLMTAVNAHLSAEYSKKRLTGTDYSKVYLGAMQSVMSQSIQFILQKDISAKQAELLDQQIINAQAELLNIQAQTSMTASQELNVIAEGLNIPKQGLILDEQLVKIKSDVALVDLQSAKITKEIEAGGIADQEVLKAVAQVSLIAKQELGVIQETLNAAAQNDVITKQALSVEAGTLLTDEQRAKITKELEPNGLADKEVLHLISKIGQTDAQVTLLGTENTKAGSENALIGSQKLKVDADVLIAGKQLLHVTAQTATEDERAILTQKQQLASDAETASVNERTLSAQYNRTDIMPAQKAKLTGESLLVTQKHESERAQTSDTLLDGITAVTGSIGKQKALQEKQSISYDRNNEYKLTKLMVDTFNVGIGSNAASRNTTDAGLNDAEIKEVVDAARANLVGNTTSSFANTP